MRLIFGLFCCLGASLVVKTVDAVHYDTNYIQAPCDNNRNFTLGANGYQRYGFIGADDDGCYNTYSHCRIQMSTSTGYYITLRFQRIAIQIPDVLLIKEGVQTHRIEGYITPPYSINSTSNWMNLEFSTYADAYYCLVGFNLYYTSFHYGECSENEFRCSLDGRCIPNEVVCDSYDNCGDWSDEWAETCSGLSTSTVTAVTPPDSMNSTYDHSYIQAPCAYIGNRNFTLGANGYKRYGHIEADDDGCYNPHSYCGIRLSASPGYYITVRFDWVDIYYSDVLLLITKANDGHAINGGIIPPHSIYSTSNWMDLLFSTGRSSHCFRGFSLRYTSFHYGECSENEFRCPVDGRCIPNEVVCDSYDNCGDWSDEWAGTCGGLSTSTVTAVTPPESANPVYDQSNIQAPCDNSRNFTLGANGYQRYGFIGADDDGCYDPNSTCRIRLSVSTGYYITSRFQWISIASSDVLIIAEAAETHRIYGYSTPLYSIYSTSNWMNLEFVTSSYSTCLAGFRLYYNSFHYGECSENEYSCPYDGRCIPNEVVCDSYDNCGDWSDEWAATCSGSGLTTGAIVAISVTCALVGIALSAFLAHCINRRKQQRRSSSSSSSSVHQRRSNPSRNAATSEPLGFVEPIGPPKYIDAPPAYTNINSIYEDPDQIHPPPYQSTFTTTPYGSSNNNGDSLTCYNDSTPRLNNHEDNSNRADRGNSNGEYHC